MRFGWLLLLGACGRINFDPLGPAGGDATGGDATGDSPVTDFPTVASGFLSLPGGSSIESTTIAPVDPARSLLLVSYSSDTASASDSLVRADLEDTDQVVLRRLGNATDLGGAWNVISWTGWSVQRGVSTLPPGQLELLVPLPVTVDPARSFVIATYTVLGSSVDEDDMVRYDLRDGDNVRFALSNDQANPITLSWQVVEIPSARVVSGNAGMAGSISDFGVATAPFDPARSWLIYSHSTTTFSTSAAPYAVAGRVVDGTSLSFTRDASANVPLSIAYAVVELADGRVERDAQAFGVGQLENNIALAGFVEGRTFPFGGGFSGRGGRSTYATDTNQGTAWVRMALSNNAQTLDVIRKLEVNAALIPWQVIALKSE